MQNKKKENEMRL